MRQYILLQTAYTFTNIIHNKQLTLKCMVLQCDTFNDVCIKLTSQQWKNVWCFSLKRIPILYCFVCVLQINALNRIKPVVMTSIIADVLSSFRTFTSIQPFSPSQISLTAHRVVTCLCCPWLHSITETTSPSALRNRTC